MTLGRTLLAVTPALVLAGISGDIRAQAQSATPSTKAEERPLSEDEIRALAERAIANQHRDDAALKEYERIERDFIRDSDQRVLGNKFYRVVPTGTGTLKLLVKENGRAVDAGYYRKQLFDWEQVLEIDVHPDDPREKAVVAKAEKKAQERKELVDAARHAFHAKWLGRERRDGGVFEILQLEPNPDFHPRNNTQDLLTHARATVWIEAQSGQLERGEADIIRDIGFGGGILGKVYRGGHFEMKQAEVAPGIWLPTRYQYDYQGRKFLFGFDTHDLTEISHYRRIGPPNEALAVVRSELQSGQMFNGDP